MKVEPKHPIISFIIPVKNRNHDRIQRCVDSLQSKWTREVLICDYGSLDKLKEIKGATIFRYTRNKIWNKSHAINLMIKKAKGSYIGTVDCDMILHPDFMWTVRKYLYRRAFLYSLNVKRLARKDLNESFFIMDLKSKPWMSGGRRNLTHNADGGIQIFSKPWIKRIGGLDESFIYWGGMDNDMRLRATMSGLTLVNLNVPILHQEHPEEKEDHLSGQEKINAFKIRVSKIQYLEEMCEKGQIVRNNSWWGEEKPNQERFLEKLKKAEIEGEDFKEAFLEAHRSGESTFEFQGKPRNIYR